MNTVVNPAEQVDQAFYYIIGISFLLLILITVVMVYFAFRYHQSRNPEPSDIRGNWKLEAVWTIIPTIIALSMFAVGWNAYTGLRTAPEDALEIEALAQQFSWIFIYPEGEEVENELVVPKGKAVKLAFSSFDVLHGFFLPAYRVKVDVVPELTTYAWFLANREGEFDIHCTEYCGTGHAEMNAKLKVVSQEEYETWLSEVE